MISIRCDCGEVFHAQDEHVGFLIQCRRCGTRLTVAVQRARAPRQASLLGQSQKVPSPEIRQDGSQPHPPIPTARQSILTKKRGPWLLVLIMTGLSVGSYFMLTRSADELEADLRASGVTPQAAAETAQKAQARPLPASSVLRAAWEAAQVADCLAAKGRYSADNPFAPKSSAVSAVQLDTSSNSPFDLATIFDKDPLDEAWERAQKESARSRETLTERASRLARARTDAVQSGAARKTCSADPNTPGSGAELRQGRRGGYSSLTVDNGTGDDAVVALFAHASRRVVRRIYVRAGERGQVLSIPRGFYSIRFALGADYSRQQRTFCRIEGASEFDRVVEFQEISDDEGIRYSVQTITLHRVVRGNAPSHTIDPSLVFQDSMP